MERLADGRLFGRVGRLNGAMRGFQRSVRELGISEGRLVGGDWEKVLAGWTDGLAKREIADVESSGGGLTSCYFDIICWVGGEHEI